MSLYNLTRVPINLTTFHGTRIIPALTRISQYRFQSNQNKTDEDWTIGSSAKTLEDEVPDEEFSLSKFEEQSIVPEGPITSLNILERNTKVKKTGSFSVDLFTGRYDHDYLIYPEPLYDRIENQKLKDQSTMVKQLYPQIWNDEKKLQQYNFHNMFQLSVTEMMTIFEAIGSSTDSCYEKDELVAERGLDYQSHMRTQVMSAIISLIIRNCLTFWPIHKSSNQFAKSLIPQKHISFGGSATTSGDPTLPIGFCWTEQAPKLGSLPPQEWQTTGIFGGQDLLHYLIKGQKTNVFHNESSEHYLLFFRDQFLSEKHDTDELGCEPNPSSDPFAGCCILHKSEIAKSPIYYDSAGLEYIDIQVDTTVPNDRIIFPPQRKDPTALNIKALGQLASCAVTLGLLKNSLRTTYKYLLDYKSALLTCDIISKKLTIVTSKIFSIESMLYYIAGIYDGLEDGFDAHMETTILKIITYESAFEIIQQLQQVNGAEMFRTSKLQDQINILDSFLDGNIYNRLYLANMGILWFARSKNVHLNKLRLAPWYFGYNAIHLMRRMSERGDWLNIDADIFGHLHPSLRQAATNLEYIVKRIKYATEILCMKYGADVTSAQSALYNLAQINIDAFTLTTICSRASKSYCNGSRNASMDVALATTISTDLVRKVRYYIEELDSDPVMNLSANSSVINELNIKHGGYYAESPLDPNI